MEFNLHLWQLKQFLFKCIPPAFQVPNMLKCCKFLRVMQMCKVNINLHFKFIEKTFLLKRKKKEASNGHQEAIMTVMKCKKCCSGAGRQPAINSCLSTKIFLGPLWCHLLALLPESVEMLIIMHDVLSKFFRKHHYCFRNLTMFDTIFLLQFCGWCCCCCL